MNKTFGALAIAATLAVATVAVPNTAEAKCYGCAFAGGVVAGAIVTGAIVNSRPAYAYQPVNCFWKNKTFFDGYVWRTRPVQVCY